MLQCMICDAIINENKIITTTSFDELAYCFAIAEIKRNMCDGCGLIFGPQEIITMSKEDLNLIYLKLYKNHSNTYNTSDYFNFFRMNPTIDKKYVNYACGSNPAYISNIRKDGYNLIGYDVSLSQENEYLYQNLDNCPIKKFNGLISHNYIEHVQNPVEWFIELNKIIHMNEIMIHSTGCIGYVLERSPFHLFFHTPKTLLILAQRTGFNLEDFKKFKVNPHDTLDIKNVSVSDYNSNHQIANDEGVYFVFKKIKDV